PTPKSHRFFTQQPASAIQPGQFSSSGFLFLAAALVAGRLASRLRMQVIALRAANRHARARQQLGRQLASAAGNGEVAQAGRHALEQAM
ncbi:hypothetical protein KC218_23850, partial [Mycobacterium tuberculosis]|nr:hypothetical protein [Mycobacterium tuberculosis]